MKQIIWYLKGTCNKGYILCLSKEKWLDCYIDVDFAGMWDTANSDDPSSVKYRTGYVIMFANCPVLWVSKLQMEIALLTMEAEYIALSQAMHNTIPMQAVDETASITNLKIGKAITHSKIFKDKMGCIELVNAPMMQPRVQHIAIKYHHFHEHVQGRHTNQVDCNNRTTSRYIYAAPSGGIIQESTRATLRRVNYLVIYIALRGSVRVYAIQMDSYGSCTYQSCV